MYELRNYIIKNVSLLFISIFAPIFVIASLTILVELATFTAFIHLTIWEMFKLYIFMTPMIIFYTIPIAFFISAVITLYRFSADSEMVVVFSLGISPWFVFKTLLKPALLLMLLEFFTFLAIFPHSSTLYRNFKAYKKSQAKFNINASEFGHTFGDWLLYVGKKDATNKYSDVLLFNKKQKEEVLINAKRAEIKNKNNILTLKLFDGDGYSYSTQKFSQTAFEKMYINAKLNADLMKNESIIEYWTSDYRRNNKDRKLILGTMFSLFSVASLFLVLTIGIVHSRHQKSFLYLYIFLGLMFYFLPTLALQKPLHFMTIPVVLIPWLIGTFWLYKRRILARF